MANWKKVLVSGSAIEILNITASDLPQSSGGGDKIVVIDTDTGRLAYTSSAAGGGGIFTDKTGFYDTPNSLKVTGSTLQPAPLEDTNETRGASSANNNYAFIVSQSAWFNNHNVGHPNSLSWGSNLNGSIFNDYNSNTDVSEILRTIVGIISSSHAEAVASPLPNTRTFSNVSQTRNSNASISRGTTDFPEGNIPLESTDPNVQYTIDKGFSTAGQKLLENISTIYNDPNLYWDYDSVATGITSVSSDAGNPQLFGLGPKASPGIDVTISHVRQFDGDGTAFTQFGADFSSSLHLFSNSSINTVTEGIDLNTIETLNPTVIPSVYLDGLFTNLKPEPGVSGLFMIDGNNIAGHNSQSISSSGWYRSDAVVKIYTGSQGATGGAAYGNGGGLAGTSIFYFPIGQSGIFNTLQTQLSTDTSYSNSYMVTSSYSTRNLSGAPYINSITYDFYSTASNAFKPLYTNDATITSVAVGTTNLVNGNTTNCTDITNGDFAESNFTNTTQNSSGQISNAGTVFNGVTDQNGVVPNIESEIRLTQTRTFNPANGTDTNMQLITANSTDDTISVSFTTEKIDTDGTEGNVSETFAFKPHTAGTLGQDVTSGSMVLFASNDGQDTSTQTTSVGTEKFTGEAYRRTIGDCTTVGELSNSFDSGSALSNSTPRDAQVKPGFLVIPGSSYGYWYPAGTYYNAANYYWYLREFDFVTPGGPSQLAVSLTGGGGSSPTITGLDDTSTANTLSIGFIFESGIAAGAGGRTNIVDITKAISSDISTGNSNPFTSNINLVGWTGGSAYSSGAATIVFSEAANLTINNTYSKVWALIRMRGTVGGQNGLRNLQLTVS